MQLNCDMGESFGAWTMGADAAVMPYIDWANIACGFHAGSPAIMARTVVLADEHGVKVGAHPGYPDLAGFGRRSLQFSTAELTAIVAYQIGAMQAICQQQGAHLHHVKPHGALYNDMQRNDEQGDICLRAVCQAMSDVAPGLPLITLASLQCERVQRIADDYGVPLKFEAFADRAYTADGFLRSRQFPDAVLKQREAILAQARSFATTGEIVCITGETIQLPADTLCVHGDNPESIATVAAIREALASLSDS